MVSVSRRSLIALGAALPLLGRLDWAVAAPPPAKTDTVLLNYNESPYGPSQAARAAMQQGIATSGRYPYKHMYALAGLFAQQQGIAEKQVAVFAGSMAALRYAVLAFTNEQRGLVMATPSYEVPREAAESNKAPVLEVNLNADHAHDLLVLRTFSKIYGMAGARLGLAVGHPDLLARLAVFGGGNVPAGPSLLAGLASLEDIKLLPQCKALNQQLRDETIAWLKGRGFTCTTSEANCFMIDVKQPAEQVIEKLAAHGVLIGRVWKNWPKWVRVTVGNKQELARFREVFATQVVGSN